MKKNKQPSVYKKIASRILKYKFSFVVSLILTVISVIGTLLVPVYIGNAIDCAVSQGNVDFELLMHNILIVAIITGVIIVTQYFTSIINNKIAYNVVKDLRNDCISKIQKLSMRYIDSNEHGDIISRVINDAEQFSDGLILGFSQLFSGVLTILGTLVFMLKLNIYIALVVIVLTPLSLFVSKFIASRTYNFFKNQSESRAKQISFVNEMVGNIRVVKAFSKESDNINDFDSLNKQLSNDSLKAIFYSSLTNPCTRFINSLVYAGVALFGAIVSIKTGGAFSIGILSCFLSYANQYTRPFNEISGVVTELQNAIVCAERVTGFIDEDNVYVEAGDAIEIDTLSGDFEFKNVSFSYTKERPLIENFNLNVKSGQKIAIVGPTGCGKTTLINLLMRFYDIDSGTIIADKTDISKITKKSFRKCIGMVLQDTWIKHGTVIENITLGNPDYTREQVIEAAKATHAHSFIKRLPNGYDTVLDENDSLSQGQRQLLCIARVFLNMPPVLILDEATSSIDTMTEMRIQRAFNKLTKGKTTFVVAHRLSTIEEADLILVMNDGNIVEQGNHKELLAKKGFYYDLYNSQFAK